MTGRSRSFPIDRYLDGLFLEVRRLPARDARGLLAEAEAHLRDAADEAERGGLCREDAEALAVERFGPAGAIVRAERRRSVGSIARSAALSAWVLGSVGAVAVGVSGALALAMRLAGASDTFLAGSRSTAHLGAADCARWLRGYPQASSCAQAAVHDWAWETVTYRIAFGVLGVCGLAGYHFARRRWSRLQRWRSLPPAVADTIAATLFTAAAIVTTALAGSALVSNGGGGAGQWLSAAPIAAVAAVAFGLRLVRTLRAPT
jgi:hypothetical protein